MNIRKILFKILKRFFDVSISFIVLILLIPFFIFIALLIKIDSNGPVFYRHKRIGKNYREFYVIKFRTMQDGAEMMISQFDKEKLKEWYSNYKIKDDIRVTRVGRILRKSSIDELPQLINILVGDMSIVGPRPITKDELYDKWPIDVQKKIMSVKPGLTGYWATHGRSNVSYSERIKLEEYYVNHISLLLDLQIIISTIPQIIKQDGAT